MIRSMHTHNYTIWSVTIRPKQSFHMTTYSKMWSAEKKRKWKWHFSHDICHDIIFYFAYWVIFHAFLSSADFFQNQPSWNILWGIPSRGQKFHASVRNYKCNLEKTSNSSQSTCPVGWVFWEELLEEVILHILLLVFFIAYATCVCRTIENCKSLVLQDKWNIEIFLSHAIRVSNSLDPDQAWWFVGSDLIPNCLQRLSADDMPNYLVS